MKSFNFIPFTSVGPISFGETREKVRNVLGGYREYKKNKFSSNTLDDFGFCQVFYSKENQVEAVEFYRNVELIYDGVDLFRLNEKGLIDLLNDPDVKKDEYSATFPSLGVSISFIEKTPDAVLVYQKGYM